VTGSMKVRVNADPVAGLDPYERRHLIKHLCMAGRIADVNRVLALERRDDDAQQGSATAQNAWYAAQLELGDSAGFADDVELAWSAVEEQATAEANRHGVAPAIGLAVRYGLLSASIETLAVVMPSALRAELVRKGVWGLQRALVDARRTSSARAVALLAPHAQGEQRSALLRETLDAAVDKEVPGARIMAENGPEADGAIIRALATAAALSQLVGFGFDRQQVRSEFRERIRATWQALVAQPALLEAAAEQLAPFLDPVSFREAVSFASAGNDGLLRRLARYSEDLGDAAERMLLASQRSELVAGDGEHHSDVGHRLSYLARTLRPSLIPEALALACSLDDGWRAEPLAALAARVPAAQRLRVIARAKRDCESMQLPGWRTRPLLMLAPLIPPRKRGPILREIIDAILQRSGESRAHALSELVPLVRRPAAGSRLQLEVLAAVLTLTTMRADAREEVPTCLEGLAKVADLAVLPEVVATARNHADDLLPRVLAIAGTRLGDISGRQLLDEAARLGNDLWEDVGVAGPPFELPMSTLRDCLHRLERIGDGEQQARTLAAVATELHGSLRRETATAALALVRVMPDPNLSLLVAVCPPLPDSMFGMLIDCYSDDCPAAPAWVAEALAPWLPERLLLGLLHRVREVEDAESRARALHALSARFPGPERVTIQAQAVEACGQTADEQRAGEILAGIGSQLPAVVARQIVSVAREMNNQAAGALARVACTRELPAPERQSLLREALEATRGLYPGVSMSGHACDDRLYALAGLVPFLLAREEEEVLAEALEALRLVNDAGERSQWLGRFAPLLDASQVREAFSHLADGLTATDLAVEAFCALVPRLPDDLVPAALEFIAEHFLGLSGSDAEAIEALAHRLGGPLSNEALQLAHRVEWPRAKARALASVLPLLSGTSYDETLTEALRLAASDGDLEALGKLGASLGSRSPVTRTEMLSRILRVGATQSRAGLMGVISALPGALAAAGGETVLAETAAAVRAAGRWWP
jgi:hypothetical protein